MMNATEETKRIVKNYCIGIIVNLQVASAKQLLVDKI